MVRSSLAAEAFATLSNELIYDKSEQEIPIQCVTDKWLCDTLALYN